LENLEKSCFIFCAILSIR